MMVVVHKCIARLYCSIGHMLSTWGNALARKGILHYDEATKLVKAELARLQGQA